MPKPAGVRQRIESIVLQAMRVHGPYRKYEIARLTRLNTQTTPQIVDRLIGDGVLGREARTRVQGRVGKPSVQIPLRPDGAFSIGRG